MIEAKRNPTYVSYDHLKLRNYPSILEEEDTSGIWKSSPKTGFSTVLDFRHFSGPVNLQKMRRKLV